jgi:hypothetical protein
MIVKNLHIWLFSIIAISLMGTFSCNSAVNKQTKEEIAEPVEEFEEDSAYYAADTIEVDDEGVMEEISEETEE